MKKTKNCSLKEVAWEISFLPCTARYIHRLSASSSSIKLTSTPTCLTDHTVCFHLVVLSFWQKKAVMIIKFKSQHRLQVTWSILVAAILCWFGSPCRCQNNHYDNRHSGAADVQVDFRYCCCFVGWLVQLEGHMTLC